MIFATYRSVEKAATPFKVSADVQVNAGARSDSTVSCATNAWLYLVASMEGKKPTIRTSHPPMNFLSKTL